MNEVNTAAWTRRLLRTALTLLVAQPLGLGQVALGQAPAGDADVVEIYRTANGLAQRGLHDLAEREYLRFLEQAPQHEKAPQARYALAVCLQRLERPAQAVEQLRPLQALDSFAFAAESRLLLGQCLLQLERAAEAAEALAPFDAALASHKLAPDAAVLRCEALYRAGAHQQAHDAAQGALQRWKDHPSAERLHLLSAYALVALQRWEPSVAALQAFVDRYPQSAEASAATLLLGQCRRQLGDPRGAADAFASALQRATDAEEPQARLALAGAQIDADDAAAAIKTLTPLTRAAAPEAIRADALLLLGRAHAALDAPDDAAKAFASLTDHPQHGLEARWRLARCRMQQDPQAAARQIQELLPAAASHPQIADMQLDLAISLARSGAADAALNHAQTFLSTHTNHPQINAARLLAAHLLHGLKRYDDCRDLCSTALAAGATGDAQRTLWLLLADCQLQSGAVEQSVETCRAALEQTTDAAQRAAVQLRLGIALHRLSRFEEALPPLRAAQQHGQLSDQMSAALLLADVHYQRSEWPAVVQVLESLDLSSVDTAARCAALLRLAAAHQRCDAPARALESLDQLGAAACDATTLTQGSMQRAAALLALQRFDEAEQVLTTLLRQPAEAVALVDARRQLAWLAARRGDHRAAAAQLESLASLVDGAEAPDVLLQRGQSLLAAGQAADALRCFDQFLQQHPQHPGAATAAAQRGIALSRQDRPDEAVAALREALSRPQGLDAALRAATLYECGWNERKLERLPAAVATFRALLADRPAAPLAARARVDLAELEAGAGQCESALQTLAAIAWDDATVASDKALRARAYYRTALCHFEQARYDASAEQFERLLESEPSDAALAASACYLAGESRLRAGDSRLATPHLRRVVESYPDADVAGPALLRLGEALAAQQRWESSEQALLQYLQRHPEAPTWFQAQFGVGWARESAGRHTEAIKAYRVIVERHQGPTAARAQFQIGQCLFAQNKLEDAVAELLKVDILYDYPEWSAAALFEAGRCLEGLGRSADARAQFQAVAQRFADSRWAALAQQKLAAASDGSPSRGAARGRGAAAAP